MRMLLAGGLGYIGCEVARISREAGNEVDILDTRFIPERVAILPDKVRFCQGSINDNDKLDKLIKRADVIVLLAAEVAAESSINRPDGIWKTNYTGALNVIEKCSKSQRVIFASTANVFGGIDERIKFRNLVEEDEPRPKYPYAESKRAEEKHLLASDKNYTICRFGTNYGYSPGIRFNLVTNNFVKKIMMGENLVVHGQGENFRPTVCVRDVARAILFLSEKKDAVGEIFHVVNRSYKIKNLAEEVAKYNPDIKIEFIIKEIPFSSYDVSGEKIRKSGFKFEWDLDRAVKELLNIYKAVSRI